MLIIIQAGAQLFQQKVRIVADSPQRRAQVVGHHKGVLGQLFVYLRQLDGALPHQFFKQIVVSLLGPLTISYILEGLYRTA